MKAMIFAAGLGTRLKPLTDTMPKALVPVCGKPLLWHVMTKLKASGINDVTINVHHFADMIVSYLESVDGLGMDVHISDERDMLLETGGGIRHAERYLCPAAGHVAGAGSDEAGHAGGRNGDSVPAGLCGDSERDEARAGRFLVHNVDILSDLDIRWFESQVRPGAIATLLVSGRKTSRYLLFDDDMRLVGWINVSTGEVRTPYPALDVASCRMFAFSGIHILSDGIFPLFSSEGIGERFPIMDFYLKAADRYPIYGVPATGLHLIDVGKPGSLAEAEKLCQDIERH